MMSSSATLQPSQDSHPVAISANTTVSRRTNSSDNISAFLILVISLGLLSLLVSRPVVEIAITALGASVLVHRRSSQTAQAPQGLWAWISTAVSFADMADVSSTTPPSSALVAAATTHPTIAMAQHRSQQEVAIVVYNPASAGNNWAAFTKSSTETMLLLAPTAAMQPTKNYKTTTPVPLRLTTAITADHVDEVSSLRDQLQQQDKQIQALQEQLDEYSQQAVFHKEKCRNVENSQDQKHLISEAAAALDLSRLLRDELTATQARFAKCRESSDKRVRELSHELSGLRYDNEQLAYRLQVSEKDLQYVRRERKKFEERAHHFEDELIVTQQELAGARTKLAETASAREAEMTQHQPPVDAAARPMKAARSLKHTNTSKFPSPQVWDVKARVYQRTAMWQMHDEAGKARRQALSPKSTNVVTPTSGAKLNKATKAIPCQAQGVKPRVYERTAKWQQQDEVGRARRLALASKSATPVKTSASEKQPSTPTSYVRPAIRAHRVPLKPLIYG